MALGISDAVARKRPNKSKPAERRVRLKPADPFELIRWLAHSQNDPRKAIAELVQNSLDAGARRVQILRRRSRGVALITVLDDGEGVIPELEREQALHYLATHIGHSRKLGLTPQQRAERVVAGQYGVGLLGFWCLGKVLELRTRVAGSALMALRLEANKPTATIQQLPTPLDAAPTFTEIVVSDLHDSSKRLISGRRLTDYLATELRGQLLAHEVELAIEDRQARGLAQKHFRVVPRRFVGEALQVPREIATATGVAVRIELYRTDVSDPQGIQVACAGTLVADDIRELHTLGLDHAPWVGCGLTGMVDYPEFRVPPGSRRGVAHDDAATRFTAALGQLRPAVEAELERLREERSTAADREVVRELRRALRGFRRRLPQYELPAVAAGTGVGGISEGPGEGLDVGAVLDESGAPLELFPPGPLAAVRIEPETITVQAGGERRVSAIASDADGRRLRDGVDYAWTVSGAGLELRGEGMRPAVCAAAETPPHDGGALQVAARAGRVCLSAAATICVVEEIDDGGRSLGIPEPELVADPGAQWRSRMDGERWQVNSAHEDYVSLRSEGRGRLRYLLMLLAKELVYRSYGRPGDETLLEHVVEILAHAERNLRPGR